MDKTSRKHGQRDEHIKEHNISHHSSRSSHKHKHIKRKHRSRSPLGSESPDNYRSSSHRKLKKKKKQRSKSPKAAKDAQKHEGSYRSDERTSVRDDEFRLPNCDYDFKETGYSGIERTHEMETKYEHASSLKEKEKNYSSSRHKSKHFLENKTSSKHQTQKAYPTDDSYVASGTKKKDHPYEAKSHHQIDDKKQRKDSCSTSSEDEVAESQAVLDCDFDWESHRSALNRIFFNDDDAIKR